MCRSIVSASAALTYLRRCRHRSPLGKNSAVWQLVCMFATGLKATTALASRALLRGVWRQTIEAIWSKIVVIRFCETLRCPWLTRSDPGMTTRATTRTSLSQLLPGSASTRTLAPACHKAPPTRLEVAACHAHSPDSRRRQWDLPKVVHARSISPMGRGNVWNARLSSVRWTRRIILAFSTYNGWCVQSSVTMRLNARSTTLSQTWTRTQRMQSSNWARWSKSNKTYWSGLIAKWRLNLMNSVLSSRLISYGWVIRRRRLPTSYQSKR